MNSSYKNKHKHIELAKFKNERDYIDKILLKKDDVSISLKTILTIIRTGETIKDTGGNPIKDIDIGQYAAELKTIAVNVTPGETYDIRFGKKASTTPSCFITTSQKR